MKNRKALNLLFSGFHLNLFENDLIEVVSNELTPLYDDTSAENIKNKRHDITHANTHLNRSIIRPDVQIYTYFAGEPDSNDMTDSTLPDDLAKLFAPNKTVPAETKNNSTPIDVEKNIQTAHVETKFDMIDSTPRVDLVRVVTSNETVPVKTESGSSDIPLRVDLPTIFSSNETAPIEMQFEKSNSTVSIDVAEPVSRNIATPTHTTDSPFRIDLTELVPPTYDPPNDSNKKDEKNYSDFAHRDFDHTIFDRTFLPPWQQQPIIRTFLPLWQQRPIFAPIQDFQPYAVVDDYYLTRHRTVKRDKNEPLPYLPPTEATLAPPITSNKFISNGFSDLQRNNYADQQIDVRFNMDNKEVTRASQQQLDQNDSSTLRKFAQQISTSKSNAQAYYYASIDNRPQANYGIQPPPLQSYYPASIQNNYASGTIRPLNYKPTPIPASLPSVVYSPTAVRTLPNYVQQSVKVPRPQSLTAASNAQYYSSSAIPAPYGSRPCDFPPNRPNEKVVVKIVPANGWYLNDEKERKSYYDAVARGLLNENGFVYVNDVQRYSPQSTQNIVWYSSSAPPQSPPQSPSPSSSYIPPSYPRSNQKWELTQYGSPVQVLSQPRPVQLSTFKRQVEPENSAYRGETSYNVPLKSVGKLAGDNRNETYNLASLRSSSGDGSNSSTDRIFNRRNVR